MIEHIAALVAINFAFYFKTLKYHYASDDIPASRRPRHYNKLVYLLHLIEGRARSYYRLDHALTMLFHTIVCVLIYAGFGANDISFIAAVLFSVNPANNQVSVWIAGRPYLLSTLGILAAMAIPLLAFPALLMASFFNQGFVAPLALAFSPEHSYLAYFIPFIWLFHGKRFSRNVTDKVKKEMFVEDRKVHWRKLVLATKTLGFYFIHGLIPYQNTFYHSFLQSLAGSGKDKGLTMKDKYFFIGLITIGILGYLMYNNFGTTVSFAVAWYLIGIAPFLNFFRIHQEIAERYMYLPNVGLMYLLAYYITGYPIVTTAVISIYATKMWFWMDAYRDDFFLVESSSMADSKAWFAWHVKAMKRWDAGSFHEAVIYWKMALNLSPKEFKVNYNLATAHKMSKQIEESEKYLKVAMDNIPAGQEAQSKEIIDKWKNGEVTILL